MGEAKRRKKLDPSWGCEKYNGFHKRSPLVGRTDRLVKVGRAGSNDFGEMLAEFFSLRYVSEDEHIFVNKKVEEIWERGLVPSFHLFIDGIVVSALVEEPKEIHLMNHLKKPITFREWMDSEESEKWGEKFGCPSVFKVDRMG